MEGITIDEVTVRRKGFGRQIGVAFTIQYERTGGTDIVSIVSDLPARDPDYTIDDLLQAAIQNARECLRIAAHDDG